MISAILSRAAIAAVENTSPKIGVFKSFFPVIDTVGERIIELDFKQNGTNVASYVNPKHKSKARNLKSFDVKSFILPTKKDKYVITGEDLSKKLFGSTPYAQQASKASKALKLMDDAVMDLRDGSSNRDEVSAIEQVFNGTLAIVGEGENRSLDFERSTGNTFNLGSGNYWDEAGADPKTDFDEFILQAAETGHVITDAFARPNVINALTSVLAEDNEYDSKNINNGSLQFMSRAAELGVISYGTYKNIRLWGYMGNYIDEDGVTQTAVPAKKIAFLSENSKNGTIEGYAEDLGVAMGKEGVTIDSSNFIVKVEVSDEPSEATIHGIQTSCPLLLDPDSTIVATVLA